MEIKDIEGFENYQITDDGRVWSKKRKKWMKHFYNQKGYCLITFKKDGKKHCKQIHRLVAEAFIPNPDNLPQVNHKDENKENNLVENLEFCTNEYNHNYGTRNKRVAEKLSVIFKGIKPSENCLKKAILTNSKKVMQFDKNGEYIATYDSIAEASKAIGHYESRGDISKCCKGKAKTCGGYMWKYF